MLTNMLQRYLQYQKPQIDVLVALSLPLLMGVFNFGWRVLAATLFAMFACWATEYAFTSREGKPASSAALVTGALLALILPPNVPFWQILVGSVFCLVFGKMVFGGFGRNVFNPAMVGRCALYICFPATIAAAWFVPFQGWPGGFAQWTVETRAKDVESSQFAIDGVTSATVLAATKHLNVTAREALARNDQATFAKALEAFQAIDLQHLSLGNINGSSGEGGKLLILVGLIFLLIRGVVALPLVLGLGIGMVLAKCFTEAIGSDVLPLGRSLAITFLGGGTLFATVFMVTEPITAPINLKARWVYAILIGFLGGVIRSMSSFNAGLMFAILLGNTFGPIIEIACEAWDKRDKEAAK